MQITKINHYISLQVCQHVMQVDSLPAKMRKLNFELLKFLSICIPRAAISSGWIASGP